MEVILKNNKDHPQCPHGPCLMFERFSSNGKRTGRKFYACSACRNRSDCSFFQWVDEKASKQWSQHRKLQVENAKPPFSQEECTKRLELFKKLPNHQRNFCKTCSLLLLSSEIDAHSKHDIYFNADSELLEPSSLFHPFVNNKAEAQYFFTPETTDFIVQLLRSIGYTKLVLIGVPKIHEYIISKKTKGLSSFLMDIDHRFMQFFNDKQFCHYNMFNNHFFGGAHSKKMLKQFLSEDDGGKVALIIDPPFGGLVDAISYTLRQLSSWWKKVNGVESEDEIPLLWCFPFFNENRIIENMPHLKMMDYKVSYANHKKFRGKQKTIASPARIFTNIQPLLFILPEEGYRFCSICKRYVSQENQHCSKCNACTTKHGKTYKHCNLCERCVKNSYEHCTKCNKCVLAKHVCGDILKPTSCFLCQGVGHKKRDCPQSDVSMQKSKKKKN